MANRVGGQIATHTVPLVVKIMNWRTIERNRLFKLNFLGTLVASSVGAEEWAKAPADHLVDQARGKRPTEVEDISFNYVNSELNPSGDLEKTLHDAAKQYDINEGDVLAVLAIALRDRLLTKVSIDSRRS